MITYTQLGNMGRLCNQIFQLAVSISTALRNNDQYIFPNWTNEPYFNLHNCFSNAIHPTHTYQEPHFHYAPIPYTDTKNIVLNLNGYFQSFLYIEPYKDIILNLLTPIHHEEREEGLSSLHVRRGDYINIQNCHPILSMDYYEKAMKLSGCNKFLVFSDDIKWCKENFKGNNFEFSEGQAPHRDLVYMIKKCQSNIIANSSFSWVGAYFNQSKNKTVIAPKTWFGPQLSMHNLKDLRPTDWILV